MVNCDVIISVKNTFSFQINIYITQSLVHFNIDIFFILTEAYFITVYSRQFTCAVAG